MDVQLYEWEGSVRGHRKMSCILSLPHFLRVGLRELDEYVENED
jgi:hypothetical protein